MSTKVFVVLATFVAISSGLPAVYNTSAISRSHFPKVHHGADLSNSPYLPLVTYQNVVYYFGAILGGTVAQVELFCSYHNMKLVSIETIQESNNLITGLQSFFLDILVQPSENVIFWTSGRRFNNNWRWESTGRPAHYTNWAEGEPNNLAGKENCIEVLFNSTAKTLEWNDKDCEAANYFICESRDK